MIRIAILGTGRMGSALAAALLDGGLEVTVWNRTAERTVPLAAKGAKVAETVAAAIRASDIVLVNVRDYHVSADLLGTEDAHAALKGRLVVELSSGTPGQARAAATRIKSSGGAFIAGAIMATPNFIGTPNGVILFSGPADAYARHDKTFQLLGQAQHVGVDPGLASALDLALLTQMWGLLFGTLHATAICEANGIGLADFARHRLAFIPTVEGATADLIARAADQRLAGDTATLASIAAHWGAFRHMLADSQSTGIDTRNAEAWKVIFERAIAAGYADDDFAMLTRFMRHAG